MPDLDGNDGDGQAASSELEDLVPLGMTTTKGQKDLSPVDPTEDDDGRCGDATPGEVALVRKGIDLRRRRETTSSPWIQSRTLTRCRVSLRRITWPTANVAA